MAIKVPQNEEISGGEKNGGRKGVGSAIGWGGANRPAYTLRERRGVVKKDVDPFIIRVWIKRREDVESSKRDKPCLTKMTTPRLAYVASRERMPDREWVQSECRAENPGIRKEEDELRLDS